MSTSKLDKDELFALLSPHMRKIAAVISSLGDLNNRWGTLSALAEVTCDIHGDIIKTMTHTRRAFRSSECDLSGQLLAEELNKVVERLASYAQVTADIIVRNLYERTADIGFLATDADIYEFLKQSKGAGELGKMVGHLQEYRDKYTVYDDVIILDPEGNVLASLAEGATTRVSESWFDRTLAQNGFIETFDKTVLCPSKNRGLLYSHRITDPNNRSTIGVLVLSFDFEGEMQGIFRDLRKASDTSVTLLLDSSGVVIATSDADHIPLGRRITMTPEEDPYGIIDSGGQEYIAVTRPGHPYQGYQGPGWFGHDMVPIVKAFRDNSSQVLSGIKPELLEKVLYLADALCPELTKIVTGTTSINDSLRRVVWNGQIMATRNQETTSALTALLRIVSATGGHTSEAFDRAITELHGTVISSNLRTAESTAALMIDIMDRNLYERANDCRWWALNSDIRRILTAGKIDPQNQAEIIKILEYINGLYTVYTRLVVYDITGTIVAASNYGGDSVDVMGKRIDGSFVPETFATQNTQQYRVSSFESTWLYGDGLPSYIYSAAIRSSENPAKVVGGIGVVFDSGPQFQQMLDDCLPKTPGSFGLFVEKSTNRIIATSKESGHGIGEHLRVDREFFSMPPKSGMSRIVLYRGFYYVVGCHMSRGYREYKNSGDYSNDILAFVFMPIGKEDLKERVTKRKASYRISSSKGKKSDFGTFFIGDQLFAIPAESVCTTIEASQITNSPGTKAYIAGVVLFRADGELTLPIPVISGRYLFSGNQTRSKDEMMGQVVIILRANTNERSGYIGLLVDELESVISVPCEQVQTIPHISLDKDGGYTGQALMLEDEKDMPVLISVIYPNSLLAAARRK